MGAARVLGQHELERIGGDPFSMTVAGLRLARIANGVAELHGETARKMWKDVRRRADHRDHQRRPRADVAGRPDPRRVKRGQEPAVGRARRAASAS